MAEKIRIIGKERKEVKEKLENFKSDIIPKQTKRIYFLGFGFIKQNCDLFCATPDQLIEIYYINFDNSQKIRRAFESMFNPVDACWAAKNHTTSHRGVYEAIQKDFEFKID